MKIGILGAGSLGTIIGALITEEFSKAEYKNAYEVILIDTNKEHIKALNSKGAHLTGYLDLHIPVTAISPEEMEGEYDLIILLTKQVFNDIALTNLKSHLKATSTVCTLQNGIPEEFVAQYVGKKRTIGGAVGFGATWVEAGVSAMTSSYETMKNFAFDIGEIDGTITPRIKEVQKILSSVGKTEILTNLMDIRWTKVLMNATFSGMSAALGSTFGAVLDNEIAMRALAQIADETIKSCNANGNKIIEMQGIDMSLLELKNGETIADKLGLYHQVWDQHRDLKASMLQDLEKKIPCEIDYINGIVAKKGNEKGVKTPFNDMVIKLVKQAQAQKVVPDFTTNLEFFKEILA